MEREHKEEERESSWRAINIGTIGGNGVFKISIPIYINIFFSSLFSSILNSKHEMPNSNSNINEASTA
ncbi:unnamed protein product [Rotaria socialis]|uniref:Uncharacterized protein n=1 Tax=Rotaria socialis TaxID=392032 RepID=A0A820BN68_9BILA|nr:unnamed protein product [Rotaria socialis]CAF4530321.1 unnamed protein product [Rotaria socialis]CAF4662266.1 unnamed protein product [Rotaria socialis]CAF4662285.1 unnamed protein product [Rotaria socialis]CAF4928321.1 unnamed protein product [Rotaria socialis]